MSRGERNSGKWGESADGRRKHQQPWSQAQTTLAVAVIEPVTPGSGCSATTGTGTQPQTNPWHILHCLLRQKDANNQQTSKSVLLLYTCNTGANWYGTLYGTVKSLFLKDICLSFSVSCLYLNVYKWHPFNKFVISILILNSIPLCHFIPLLIVQYWTWSFNSVLLMV